MSLLHASAMPITDLGNSPMIPTVGEIKQNSHDHHAPTHHDSDHEELRNYCPETENPCCLIVVLQPDSTVLFALFSREGFCASRSLSQPILRPEALYRPPKFCPAFAR